MQTLDDPPHFKIWPYLISFSFLFLKIFPRCYIPIFDGLVLIGFPDIVNQLPLHYIFNALISGLPSWEPSAKIV